MSHIYSTPGSWLISSLRDQLIVLIQPSITILFLPFFLLKSTLIHSSFIASISSHPTHHCRQLIAQYEGPQLIPHALAGSC